MTGFFHSESGSLAIGHLRQSGFETDEAVSIHSMDVLRALHSLGHDVTLLALLDQRRLVTVRNCEPAVVEDCLGFAHRRSLRAAESAVRFVQHKLGLPYLGAFDSLRFKKACIERLSHCDILYETYSLMSLGGVWANSALSIPLVLEVHADMINMEMPLLGKRLRGVQFWLAEFVTRQCFGRATRIVAISELVADRLRTYWGIPADLIVTIPPGADPRLFAFTEESRETRSRFSLSTDPIVMFVGFFFPWHGLCDLITAFARVVSEIPEVKLVLVGDGPTRPDVETQVRHLALSEKVVFTGRVIHQEVPALLSIADVAVAPCPVLPSEPWGSPQKLYEYMAAGRAIVATRVGSTAQTIRDGHNGLLVAAGDTEALGDAITRLLKDAGLRTTLGDNARKEAIEKHSYMSRARMLEEVFHSALGIQQG